MCVCVCVCVWGGGGGGERDMCGGVCEWEGDMLVGCVSGKV